jgi:hypothetical protein
MTDTTPEAWQAMDAETRKAAMASMGTADLVALLERLLAWHDDMGGWEAKVWRDAETTMRRANGQPEPEDDDTISPEA